MVVHSGSRESDAEQVRWETGLTRNPDVPTSVSGRNVHPRCCPWVHRAEDQGLEGQGQRRV